MKNISFDQSPVSYYADFVLYPIALCASLIALAVAAPQAAWVTMLALVGGFILWSPLEYVIHRIMLHNVQPFKAWHDEHHQRPYALIGTPTLLSLALFVVFGFLPLTLVMDLWLALAITTGIVAGYFFYVVVHHATHHWRARPGSWLAARKRDHALHHKPGIQGWYGVTTSIWDRLFSTTSH